MKIIYAIILPLLCGATAAVHAQAPPPMSMPNVVNKVLVDSLIKITHHEQYVINYCTKKIKEHAAASNWPEDKTKKVLESIVFRYYSDTIYNSYADYTTEELQQLLAVLGPISKKTSDGARMMLTNAMMQSNLDLFVRSLIGGVYLKR